MWRMSSVGRRRHDAGAVAVIVSVLVGFGVVMGSLAISVDIGSIMSERRQLQNGADAASLALAQICSKSDPKCASDSAASYGPAAAQVKPLADANAKDGLTEILSICGKNVSGFSDTCAPTAADAGELGKCNPLPSGFNASAKYVEVRTRTQSSSGNTVLTPFARALANGSSGSTVYSCARAAWGPEGATIATLPITIGVCNWNNATANGTKFAPSPPYTPAPSAAASTSSVDVPNPDVNADGVGDIWPRMTQIFAHVNGSEGPALAAKFPCGQDLNAQSGLVAPGGFGWVKTCKTMTNPPDACSGVTDSCLAAFLSTGNLQSDPGASMPTDCKTILPNYVGKEVEIPVTTGVTGSGGSAVFAVDGISTFFIAGISGLPGVTDAVVYNDDNSSYRDSTCMDTSKTPYKRYQSTCMWGWFTSPIKPVGSLGGGSSRGPTVVAPAG